MTNRVEHLAEGVTLYLGDCREILQDISCDLLITSPPYAQQRDYGGKIDDWASVVSAIAAIKGESAQVFVNLGLVHKNGEVFPYWDGLVSNMKSCGWRLFGWYVWDKGYAWTGGAGRLPTAHEFIFHFNKTTKLANKFIKTQGKKYESPRY